MSRQEVVATKLLENIGDLLKEEGVSLEGLIASGRDIRGEIIQKKHGLTEA